MLPLKERQAARAARAEAEQTNDEVSAHVTAQAQTDALRDARAQNSRDGYDPESLPAFAVEEGPSLEPAGGETAAKGRKKSALDQLNA